MELLTAELRARLPALYSQEHNQDPTVHCKFFTPDSNWTWLVTEGSAEDGDFLFFGYLIGLEGEWGYFVLSEMESVRGPLGLAIRTGPVLSARPVQQGHRAVPPETGPLSGARAGDPSPALFCWERGASASPTIDQPKRVYLSKGHSAADYPRCR